MAKTLEEINEKIRSGRAIVVTAEEMVDIVAENGAKEAAQRIDVVTTGTFGAMCSSGVMLNLGHSKPRIKFGGGEVRFSSGLVQADTDGNRVADLEIKLSGVSSLVKGDFIL